MTTKDERMIVDWSDDATAGGSDVGQHTLRLGVVTEAAKIEIICRWGLRLVHSRTESGDVFDVVILYVLVPSDTQAIPRLS